MNSNLDKQLCEEFPILYADRDKPIYESAMGFGFCVDDGWFDLIYNLSKNLTNIINELPKDQQKSYKVAQVKSKFGNLRYYMQNETPEMTKLIMAAECKSEKICEICGNTGQIVSNKGYLKALCNNHASELNFS